MLAGSCSRGRSQIRASEISDTANRCVCRGETMDAEGTARTEFAGTPMAKSVNGRNRGVVADSATRPEDASGAGESSPTTERLRRHHGAFD